MLWDEEGMQEDAAFICPLVEREPRDWPAMDAAFDGVAPVSLFQGWCERPEPRFRPAAAKMARTRDALLVAVDLEDEDVFNPVAAFNEPAFLRGDVVEVFVLPAGTDRYLELHSTPDGALLQLRWTVGWREAGAPPDLRESLIAAPVARVLTRRTPGGWSALVAIPFDLIGSEPQVGDAWRATVSRYDYTRGEDAPVLSATPPFRKVDFHQAALWNRLVFTK